MMSARRHAKIVNPRENFFLAIVQALRTLRVSDDDRADELIIAPAEVVDCIDNLVNTFFGYFPHSHKITAVRNFIGNVPAERNDF